jgi:mono/diheme cytochrome c family protein
MPRILELSLILVAAGAAPALAGEVPFAAPPPSIPGQPQAYVAPLGDIMGKIQLRHIKLWDAIKHRNWDLLDYELSQTKDAFGNAVILYRNIPVEFIAAAGKPLTEMQKAAKAKDSAALERGYAELTSACNACHIAAGAGFIAIKAPTASPFSDQEFSPKEK